MLCCVVEGIPVIQGDFYCEYSPLTHQRDKNDISGSQKNGTESGRFLPCQLSFFAGGAVTGGLVDVGGGAIGEFWGAIC
jgi:hypothetical protein